MAKNFEQKAMLEDNNAKVEAKSTAFGKVMFYLSFIFIIPIFWYISKKNWFRQSQEKMIEQLSNIDAKLTERYNVLLNQLSVAKEALKHETELQTSITAARASVTGPQSSLDPTNVANKNAMVSGLTARWNLVQENYPQIVTMPVMMQLAQSVKDLEADLEASRRFYTAVARSYNAQLVSYPSDIIASNLKLSRFPMFEAEDSHRANVELKF